MPPRTAPTPRRATRAAVAAGEVSPPGRGGRPAARGRAPGTWVARLPSTGAAFAILLAARLAAAAWHIVHDCDEVYNYWEPLHYLLHKSGFQTWEYSSAFALRPWVYLALHAPAAAVGGGAGVRALLAAATAAGEAALFAALRDVAGPGTAAAFLALSVPSPGMYAAAPALLPSSFVMVSAAAAGAAALRLVAAARATKAAKPALVATFSTRAIAAAAVGLLWGWPVAAPAFAPHAAAVLVFGPGFLPSAATAAAATVALLAPLAAVDRVAYGRWTLSLANFLAYNVAGGGESSLYGVEPPSFYAKAAVLALGGALPLALAAPALAVCAARLAGGAGRGAATPPPGAGTALAWAAGAPAVAWLAAITALPHKEDRFLYPVFPLVHAVAAFGLACVPAAVRGAGAALVGGGGRRARPGAVGRAVRAAAGATAAAAPLTTIIVAAALGLARCAALWTFYGAPRRVWGQLPPVTTPARVCVGAEWHRFPGAFSLPAGYEPALVASDFGGLLPARFDPARGGSAAAPPTLNDRNEHEEANELEDAATCDFFVGVAAGDGGDAPPSTATPGGAAWETVASAPFVDAAASPPGVGRWLYVPGVPGLDGKANAWVSYVLLKQQARGGW